MNKFNFPCRKEDIEKCNDIAQLNEWNKQFEEELTKAEFAFGQGFDEAPDNIKKFLWANEKNQKAIKHKILLLTNPVSPIRALRMFHDVAKSFTEVTMYKGEARRLYDVFVEITLDKLGRPNGDFNKMIDQEKPNKFRR